MCIKNIGHTVLFKIFFEEIIIFIQQECIKLIKSENKVIHLFSKVKFQINAVCLFAYFFI